MKKNCCWVYYKWEPDNHIRGKVKVILDLSNYATKESDHATGVDTSDLAATKDFIALKAEVDKLVINKLVNVSTSLNNLKTKVDGVDIGKLRTVPVDLKTLSDVVEKMEMLIKNTRYKWFSDYNCFEHKNYWSWEQNS